LNFRQHADTELVLGPGITGIIGPNGSGKTTLLEAMAWAIYGNVAARGDKDSIRNLRAKARSSVRVEMEFGVGAHEYKVIRGLHNAELYRDGQLVANSLTEVTAQLERGLGMTHDEFFNTYFTGQKDLAVMAKLTRPERAAFLSRVLRYEQLSIAQERIREQRNALAAELHGREVGLPEPAALERERATAAARLEQARRAAAAAQAVRTRAPEVDAREAPAGDALAGVEREAHALAGRLEVAERAAEEQRAAWVREKEYATTRRADLLKQYDEVKEQRDKIERLGPEGTCPTCRRPLGAEYAAVLGVLDRQMQAIVDDGKYFRHRLEQLAQPPETVTTAVAAERFSEQAFAAARERHDRAARALREAEMAVAETRGELTAAEAGIREVERREAEHAARERQIAELKVRLRLHQELDRAFGDLRADLNAAMRPEIAELASGFLADLTDGRYEAVDLTEDYTVTILDDGVPKPVISGGEEDVANLVLRLAISQMIAERAGQPLTLLVLDEIFGSLDESRRQHVVGLLRRLADRFPQV